MIQKISQELPVKMFANILDKVVFYQGPFWIVFCKIRSMIVLKNVSLLFLPHDKNNDSSILSQDSKGELTHFIFFYTGNVINNLGIIS